MHRSFAQTSNCFFPASRFADRIAASEFRCVMVVAMDSDPSAFKMRISKVNMGFSLFSTAKYFSIKKFQGEPELAFSNFIESAGCQPVHPQPQRARFYPAGPSQRHEWCLPLTVPVLV